jgi:hypothetical protein
MQWKLAGGREALTVSTVFKPSPNCAANLIGLVLDHRTQAERATSPEEQQALHRVADIYAVLASIDMPIEMFEQLIL